MSSSPLLCPRAPFWLVSHKPTPLRVPASCGRYRCTMCGQRKVAERLRVTMWGGSVRSMPRKLDLTLVPDIWEHAREQIKDFAYRVRKRFRFEWAWAIEPNPKGTGHHLHSIFHGEYIDREILQEMWGGRRVWVELVKGDAIAYTQKCAKVVGYNSKAALEHLEVNGGRAVHMSRGFLHGLTSREVLKLLSSGREWTKEIGTTHDIDYTSELKPKDEV